MGTTLARTAFVRLGFGAMLAAGVAAVAWLGVSASTAEEARRVPPPTVDEQASGSPAARSAVLAGGCFWGVQGVFQHVEGVVSAVSGYAGGAAATAHYEMTSRRRHRPRGIGQDHLRSGQDQLWKVLQIYFSVAHDPTELNRQGPGRRDANIAPPSSRPATGRRGWRRTTSPS